MTRHEQVQTPQGPGELIWADAEASSDHPGQPGAVLVLGHGAGGGVESWDLVALAARLPAVGVSVVRYVQPWRVAGRRVAVRPALLDEAWLPALDLIASRLPDVPLVTGGRSAGARVACRTSAAAAGVLCLSFPLHPSGRPDRSRAEELLAPTVPRLVVQGSRDPFGTGADIRSAAGDDAGIEVLDVVDAGHDLRPARRSQVALPDVRDALIARVLAWLPGCWATTGGEPVVEAGE